MKREKLHCKNYQVKEMGMSLSEELKKALREVRTEINTNEFVDNYKKRVAHNGACYWKKNEQQQLTQQRGGIIFD